MYHLGCLPANEIIPEEPLKWPCPTCKEEQKKTTATGQSPTAVVAPHPAYEVAATPPGFAIGTKWNGEYEACTILREHGHTYDIKIVSDGAVCSNVAKMYVRKRKQEEIGGQPSKKRKR